jgi:uncharacterized membrane-anchored protein YhcB (DUF1043 family)
MNEILMWTGSGFSFSVGVLVGAMLCRWTFNARTSMEKEAQAGFAGLQASREDMASSLDRIANALSRLVQEAEKG